MIREFVLVEHVTEDIGGFSKRRLRLFDERKCVIYATRGIGLRHSRHREL
jgi:hypothetical protein